MSHGELPSSEQVFLNTSLNLFHQLAQKQNLENISIDSDKFFP